MLAKAILEKLIPESNENSERNWSQREGEREKEWREQGMKVALSQHAAGSSAEPNEGRDVLLVLYCLSHTHGNGN